MGGISLIAAFGAGIISFVSPCVLPLIPAYISFISGLSMEELSVENSRTLRRIMLNSLAFILGFSIVFVALGATATFAGQLLLSKMSVLSKIAGIVIVIFGLHMAGVFKIRFLNYEKKFHASNKPVGLLGTFLVGLAFAFGWTPCVGPILAGILGLAMIEETVWEGIKLLSAYSLGLGIPFFLTGIGINRFLSVFARIKRYFKAIEIASGTLLVLVGFMIFFNYLNVLSIYIIRLFPWLNVG